MAHAGHHLPLTANSSAPTETRFAVSQAAPLIAWVKLCRPCRLKISAEDTEHDRRAHHDRQALRDREPDQHHGRDRDDDVDVAEDPLVTAEDRGVAVVHQRRDRDQVLVGRLEQAADVERAVQVHEPDQRVPVVDEVQLRRLGRPRWSSRRPGRARGARCSLASHGSWRSARSSARQRGRRLSGGSSACSSAPNLRAPSPSSPCSSRHIPPRHCHAEYHVKARHPADARPDRPPTRVLPRRPPRSAARASRRRPGRRRSDRPDRSARSPRTPCPTAPS